MKQETKIKRKKRNQKYTVHLVARGRKKGKLKRYYGANCNVMI